MADKPTDNKRQYEDLSAEVLPQKDEAAFAILAPFRGKQLSALKVGLGENGLRALWLYCDGSPTVACEFLGHPVSARSNVGREWKGIGLATNRRHPFGEPDTDLTTDDWRAIMLKVGKQKEKAPLIEWDVPRGDPYATLISLSCLHYGSRDQDYEMLTDMIQWIGDNPQVKYVLLGDLFDEVMKTSVGRPGIMPQSSALSMACEDFEPIADQCVGVLKGNHENRLCQARGDKDNLARQFAKELRLWYHGMSGFCRFHLTKKRAKQEQDYLGFWHHGYGNARTAGGRVNKLRDMAIGARCDFGCMGHTHSAEVYEHRVRGVDENGFVNRQAFPFGFAGTYQGDGPESFARERNFPPPAMGGGTMHLYISRKRVHARV